MSWSRFVFLIIKWVLLLGLTLTAAGAAALAIMFWIYGADPDLHRVHDKPKQVTRILASDGEVIGELFTERRTRVTLDRVAPIMTQAIIDSEDADFRVHEGLDFMGMLRALYVNVRSGKPRQGASTITQQVVRTFLLSPEKTIKRKIQEIILARRLESTLSKDDILTLYLNQIYFGHGRYGIEEAARFYFGKTAAELNTGEAALMAGIVQSPERLSPMKHPEAAKARQVYVLEQMLAHGHITPRDAKKWADTPISIIKEPAPDIGVAPEVVDLTKKELSRRFGDAVVPYLGLTIKTTVDLEIQKAARSALEEGLRALDERHGYRGPSTRLSPEKAKIFLKERRRALPASGPRVGETYEGVVASISDKPAQMIVDLGGWRGVVQFGAHDRYNPTGKKPTARFSANDVVTVRLAPEVEWPKTEEIQGALALELGPQAALVVIDPATRGILAMVGGYDFQAGQYNRAERAKRQPGSAFKPLVYAAALDSLKFTPATVVNDAPEVYDLWKPKNSSAKFRGPIRLREAVAHSINTVAIRVLNEIGPDRVIELAKRMGISEDLPRELSLALGSGVVTPLELTNAFATFAAGGVHAPARFLVSVGDSLEATAETAQALRPEVAFLVTSLMESVIEEGTATAASRLGRPLAGKTGTSNGGRDAWFVGFAPNLVCGVWVGFDDMRGLGKGEAGAKAALPIWIDFMRAALKRLPVQPFAAPPGIVIARIDKKSGNLAAPEAPPADTVDEFFIDGTAPTEVALAPGEVDPATLVLEQMEEDGGAE